MTKRIWVLGAPDPEMAAIEALLRECGERVEYATSDADGLVRVHSGNAYRGVTMPAALRSGYHGERVVPAGTTWYMVECDLGGVRPYGDPVVIIDHHRPGDPGYGRPPEEFLSASSLGQVITELARLGRLPTWRQCDWTPGAYYSAPTLTRAAHSAAHRSISRWIVGERFEIPRDLVHAAAADHCLAAAYRGECPGVDPDALMAWRAESRAAFQQRPVADVLADVERARQALEDAPLVTLLGMATVPHTDDHDWSRSACDGCAHVETEITVRDMRGQHVPELPEAGTRYGIAYIADGLPDRDGRTKVVASGNADVIRAFLEDWAPEEDLVDLYGDPARGFAGGYLPAG